MRLPCLMFLTFSVCLLGFCSLLTKLLLFAIWDFAICLPRYFSLKLSVLCPFHIVILLFKYFYFSNKLFLLSFSISLPIIRFYLLYSFVTTRNLC